MKISAQGHAVYPLAEAARGFANIAERHAMGKVVLKM
jgi:NADPH:quinone reductase-like Zn-dependent oxidoreductase